MYYVQFIIENYILEIFKTYQTYLKKKLWQYQITKQNMLPLILKRIFK